MSGPRVWVCGQCEDRHCILIRDEPPHTIDDECPWCGLYVRWVDANAVQIDPADLLSISRSLSDATTRVLGEAIEYLREEAEGK